MFSSRTIRYTVAASGLALAATATGMSSATAAPAPSATDAPAAHATTHVAASKVSSFLSKYKGQSVANQQGTYAGECVSLISKYLGEVYGIKTGAWGNAVDYRAGGSGGNQLKQRGFTWSTSQNFKDGDIVVWGYNMSPYGHIGIWFNGKIYDQNWNGMRYVQSHQFVSNGYLGKWTK